MKDADTSRTLVRPKLEAAGWDGNKHFYSEQTAFTDGRIIVPAGKPRRLKQKFSDFLLRYTRDITLAVVEAKSNNRPAEDGLQQAKDYATILGLKFAYATNGTDIIEYDFFTGQEKEVEKYPTPDELWFRYQQGQGLLGAIADARLVPDFHNPKKIPRYYQRIAIDRSVEAILKGQSRCLLTLATGTGKTTVAFQIRWKLWSAGWNTKGEAKGLRADIERAAPTIHESIQRHAFCGKAVSQDPLEGTGTDLLLAIRQLRMQQTEGSRESQLPLIDPSECLHPIPETWAWARLGDLCTVITDGTHLTPTYVDNGRPFLSAQHVKPFRFMPEVHRKASESDYHAYTARVKAKRGDILMTRVGAMIREAAIIDQDIDFAFYVSLCRLKPARESLYVPYLLYWLNSPYGAAHARSKTLGKGHSQGHLNLTLIRRFVVPVPPEAEQRQIVAYLESVRMTAQERLKLTQVVERELTAMMPSVLDQAFNRRNGALA